MGVVENARARLGTGKQTNLVPPVRGRTVLANATKDASSSSSETKRKNAPSEATKASSEATKPSPTDTKLLFVEEKSAKEAGLTRDKTSMPKYYKNWDRFDADAEVAKLESDVEAAERQAKQARLQAKEGRASRCCL